MQTGRTDLPKCRKVSLSCRPPGGVSRFRRRATMRRGSWEITAEDAVGEPLRAGGLPEGAVGEPIRSDDPAGWSFLHDLKVVPCFQAIAIT